MVAFISLFLGLVVGVQPVEVAVSGPVAAVELRLDGKTVGVMTAPAWRLDCDFGTDLAPHELVAVALDGDGRELARARQFLNLPHPRSELQWVPEAAESGEARSARLLWSSVDAARPETVRITFDGVALEELEGAAFDGEVVTLPPYSAGELHLLRAEAEVGEDVVSVEIPLGGESELLDSGLTAVPVWLGDGPVPTVQEMTGWWSRGGQPLRVVGLEKAPAEVLMVQDLAWWLQGRLKSLQEQALSARTPAHQRPTGLKYEDRFRLLLPVPYVAPETRSLQFPMSPDLGRHREVHAQGATDRQVAAPVAQGILSGIPAVPAKRVDTSGQRLADAVAAAGLAAAAGGRTRIVVLLAGSDEEDHSLFSPAAVRAYLERLQVPLLVWTPAPKKLDPAWGEVEDVSTAPRLWRAIRDVRSRLDRQAIVWLEGRHLPQEIELAPAAAGRLERVGVSVAALPAEEPSEDAETLEVAESPPAAAPGQQAAPDLDRDLLDRDLDLESFAEALEVQVVNVEAVVVDRRGEPVRDLAREDFEVLVDGEPVEIGYFQPPPAATGATGSTESTESTEEAPSDEVAAAADRRLVIFLDLFHLEPLGRRKVLDSLAETLAGFGAEGALPPAMVVRYDGSVEISQGFTADPAEILAAVEAARQEGAPPRLDGARLLAAEMARVGQDMAEARRLQGAERERAMAAARGGLRQVLHQLRAEGESRRREVASVLAVLRQLAASLGSLQGPKSLLYAGDRLALEPARELYDQAIGLVQADVDEAQQAQRLAAELESEVLGNQLTAELEALIRDAHAGGVTFYAVTPAAPPRFAGVEQGSAGSAGSENRALSTRDESVKAAACGMANTTGGLCQVGGTDLEGGFETALADLDAAYSLGFTRQEAPDGRFHEIEVRASRAGEKLRVRHRKGYEAKAGEVRLRDRLTTALLFGAEADGLGVDLRLGSLEAPNSEETAAAGAPVAAVLPVELRLAVDRLALLPVPDAGERQATARLLITTLAADGRATEVQEFPVTVEVPEARLQAGPAPTYLHKVRLALAPGTRRIAIGLWDEVGRTGTFLRRNVPEGLAQIGQSQP